VADLGSDVEVVSRLPFVGDPPELLLAVADGIDDGSRRLSLAGELLDSARRALRAAWRGVTAEIGDASVARLQRAAAVAVARLNSAGLVLRSCAEFLTASRQRVLELRTRWVIATVDCEQAAAALSLAVTPEEVARWEAAYRRGAGRRQLAESDWAMEATSATSATRAAVTGLRAALGTGGTTLVANLGITSAVQRQADTEAQWAALGPDERQQVLASTSSFPPAAGNPVRIQAAWASLDALQQLALAELDPARLARLDGLPAAVRHRANLTALDGALLAAVRDYDALRAAPPPGAGQFSRWAVLADTAARVTALNALRSQFADPHRATYLLGFDATGSGRAIISLGNPDLAENVAVLVPGTASDLESLSGDLARAAALRDSAAAAGAPNTASIVWLDYTAPPSLALAMSDDYAMAAVPALDGFLRGLRSAHHGAPAQTTLVLHSYAAMAGAQAAAKSLPVDRMVIVGGTGTELRSVGDLHFDGVPDAEMPGRVFSVMNEHDLVQLTRVVHPGLASEPVFGATVITVPGTVDARSMLPGPFNFPVAQIVAMAETHSQYWDPGSPALAAQGRIIANGRP
jgi:hypothetical protein